MDSLGGLKFPSLLVATASGRDPKWPYPHCLAEMMALTRTFEILRFKSEIFSSVDEGRCLLAWEARRKGFSHILFIDDDHGFPADTADQLLKHKKPVVAANYTSRSMPLRPLACKNGKPVHSKGHSGLEIVDSAPGGIMMIETHVFDAIEMPWFKTDWIGPGIKDWISDDYYFCQKARERGFDIFIDHDLSQEIDHVGEYGFNHTMLTEPEPEDFLEIAKELLSCI